MKVQDLLAIVGGLMKTLLVVGRFLVKPISKLSLHSELVNELFVFEEQRNRRLRKSLVRQDSINSNNFNFDPYLQEGNKAYPFQKEPNLPLPIALAAAAAGYPQQSQKDFKLQSQVQRQKPNDKNTSQASEQVIQQGYITTNQNLKDVGTPKYKKLGNPIEQINNNNRSNHSLFKIEHIEQQKVSMQNNSKRMLQTQKREGSLDFNNVQLNYPQRNSVNNNNNNINNMRITTKLNPLSSYSNAQYNVQKQVSPRAITPKSKFQQEAMATQQNAYELINLKKVRSRTNSNKSNTKEELIQQAFFPNKVEGEEKIKRNCLSQSPNRMDNQKDGVNLSSQANSEKKQQLSSHRKNQKSECSNNEAASQDNEKRIETNKSITKINNSNSQNNILNVRRANKFMTTDGCINQNREVPSLDFKNQVQRYQTDLHDSNLFANPEELNNKPQLRSKQKNKTAQFGRKGTALIADLLQRNYQVQRGFRKTTVKQQTEDNARFSNELENMQEKPLKFTCFDYMKYYFSKLKCISKKKQIKYSVKKVTERLDIIYILQKLVEIDKLKVLLLSYEQQKLFEYMPKPVVQTDPEKQENNIIQGVFKTDLQKNWTLLNSEKGNLDKFTEAFHAYKQIQKKMEKEPLDDRLINMLDPDVRRYFDVTRVEGSQACTPHRGSRNSTLIPIKFNIQEYGQDMKQSQKLATAQIQQIKMLQQQEEIKMKLASSYIEDNNKESKCLDFQNGKFDVSPSTRSKNQMHGDLLNKIILSNNYNDNGQNQPLLDTQNGVEAVSPKSTQQFMQSQQNPSLLLKTLDTRMLMQGSSTCDQIYNVEDDIEGKVSYPRVSICFNNINNHRESFDQQNNMNSKFGNLYLHDNQFSFARQSIESPQFMFDHQNKKILKNEINAASVSNPSILKQSRNRDIANRQSIGVPISKSITDTDNEENCPDGSSQLSPLKIVNSKFSPYKMSPLKNNMTHVKRRTQSQNNLENISEQQESEAQNNQIIYHLNQNKNISFGQQPPSIFSHEFLSNSIQGKMERSSALRQAGLMSSSGNTNSIQEESVDPSPQNNSMKQNVTFYPKQFSTFYNQKGNISEDAEKELNSNQSSSSRDNRKQSSRYNKDQNQQPDEENGLNTPPLAHRQPPLNKPSIITHQQHPKHRKNTNSMGSHRSMSNFKKELNSSYLNDSPVLEDVSQINNLYNFQTPHMNFLNPFQLNRQSQVQGQEDKVISDSQRQNDSLKNQLTNKVSSFQSVQSIPEENLRSMRGNIKFKNTHENKFIEEKNFKNLLNNQKEDSLQNNNEYVGEMDSPPTFENNRRSEEFTLRNNLHFVQSQTVQNTPNHHQPHVNMPNRISAPTNIQNSPQIVDSLNSELTSQISPTKRSHHKDLFQPFSESSSQNQKIQFQQTFSIHGSPLKQPSVPNQDNQEMENQYYIQRPLINADVAQQRIFAYPDNAYQDNQNPTNQGYSRDQINLLNSQYQNEQRRLFVNQPNSRIHISQLQNDGLDLENQEDNNQIQGSKFQQVKESLSNMEDKEQFMKQMMQSQVSINRNLSNIQHKNNLNLHLLSVHKNTGSLQSQQFIQQSNKYDSPYTQQQNYMKKKKQEQMIQELRQSQNMQYNYSYHTLTPHIKTNEDLPNHQHFNFDNIDKINGMESQYRKSHQSIKSSQNFNKPDIYQKNPTQNIIGQSQQNTYQNEKHEQNGQEEMRKSQYNQDLILTTEQDENKDFIIRDKQESTSQTGHLQGDASNNLIEFNKTSRNNSDRDLTSNQQEDHKEDHYMRHEDTLNMNKSKENKRQQYSPLDGLIKPGHGNEQDHFQTLNSESEPIFDLNFSKNKHQAYAGKNQNSEVIIFDEKDSDEISEHDDSVHLNKSPKSNVAASQQSRSNRKYS